MTVSTYWHGHPCTWNEAEYEAASVVTPDGFLICERRRHGDADNEPEWRHEPLTFTGPVTFYGDFDEDWLPESERDETWYEYDAVFVGGRLTQLHVIGSARMDAFLELWKAREL